MWVRLPLLTASLIILPYWEVHGFRKILLIFLVPLGMGFSVACSGAEIKYTIYIRFILLFFFIIEFHFCMLRLVGDSLANQLQIRLPAFSNHSECRGGTITCNGVFKTSACMHVHMLGLRYMHHYFPNQIKILSV